MENARKYIKKSNNGGFFLHIESKNTYIDHERKTKLWLSSAYLITEAINEDIVNATNIIDELIEWNKARENYEECQKLIEIKKKYIKIP